jgi:gamma-glutamyltranspeptidase/glutathione hydrolase
MKILAALCLTLIPSTVLPKNPAGPSTIFLHVKNGAVTSDSKLASEAGSAVLRSGGNAVDAACATALALGVVDPFASGLGGGGFALVYLAKTGKVVAIDFRETAPAGLPAKLGGLRPQSGLSVGVPGEPYGLALLVRRFGELPFSRCIQPALNLARGFSASPRLASQVANEFERPSGPKLIANLFSLDAQRAKSFRAGDRVARPALAKTLERLRHEGVDTFYQGAIAQAMVEATKAAGGVLSLDDLAHYAAVERQPLEIHFLSRRVFMMPPPSAGGVIMAQTLGIISDRLAALQKEGPGSPGYLHILAESLKHGFADRARFLADPGFVRLPLDHLLDPAYHHELSRRTRVDNVLAHDAYGTTSFPSAQPARDAGTAHISVVDKAGNAVALTTTINLEFGARIVAGDTGILLNDQMDDFTATPEHPDVFALIGSTANQPEAGKRPVSSMSPTIVVGDRGVELIAGAAGGPRIVSATLQVLLNVLLFGMDAGHAVAFPRIHHQWDPDYLFHEPGLSEEVVRALEKKGQRIKSRPDVGKANAIVRTPDGLDAAADPRSGGSPAGY